MTSWKLHTPKFQCDEMNYDILFYSPWSGHRHFAYDFVNWYKPAMIVELGTHYGCSYFTFAQAIKDFGMETTLYGIDTWQGDDFTRHDYNDNVFQSFFDILSQYYDTKKCFYYRMTFDAARERFNDESINLLHIDGSHNYSDVRHDFETWLPKMKKDGVIFLHDISEDKVNGEIMGSHNYWKELESQFNCHVSFDFSWGLGLIFLDKSLYECFLSECDISKYQRLNNNYTEECKNKLRELHFLLLGKEHQIGSLYAQIEDQSNLIARISSDIEQLTKKYDQLHEVLEKEKSETEKAHRTIEYLNRDLHQKQCYIEKITQYKTL